MTGRTIFVFGSNVSGIHGAGAAKTAYQKHGAVWGKGHGHYGDSYAIPTRTFVKMRLTTLKLGIIASYVQEFLKYAAEHPELTFQLTPIGCGFAGYTPSQIAPLFKGHTPNILIPEAFEPFLKSVSN